MRTVQLIVLLPFSVDKTWNLICDIEKYPTFVPFLTKAYLIGELQKNAIWYDVTRILWIPAKMKHQMTHIEKNKEFAFEVFVPFGGEMFQTFQLKPRDGKTEITGIIKFDLGNALIDFLLGPILAKRLYVMLAGMFTNIINSLPDRK